jgi:hypothetical protein
VLAQYQAQTSQLLQNPSAPTALYSTAILTSYINIARGQLAGVEGKCIRQIGSLVLVPGQRVYPFSSINLGTQAVTGIAGAIHVNHVFYAVGGGLQWFRPRPWEWFVQYLLNNPTPKSGPPLRWVQYGQGAAPPPSVSGSGPGAGGTLYVDPLPDIAYTLTLDCTCFPQPLAIDTDIEAIPYLWTDAVPYFAAYLALLSSQTSARMQEALKYKELYSEFCVRARDAANPVPLNYMYQGAPNVLTATKLGMGGGGRAAQ